MIFLATISHLALAKSLPDGKQKENLGILLLQRNEGTWAHPKCESSHLLGKDGLVFGDSCIALRAAGTVTTSTERVSEPWVREDKSCFGSLYVPSCGVAGAKEPRRGLGIALLVSTYALCLESSCCA